MQDYKDPLDLNETYNFDVLIKDNGSNFAGVLTLSPEGSTLSIMSERRLSPEFYSSQIIECNSNKNYFLLLGFEISKFKIKSLRNENLKDNKAYNHLEFRVGFVIKSSNFIDKSTLFTSLSIESDIIRKWTGVTKNQVDMLLFYGDSNSLVKDVDETLFRVSADDGRKISLSYSVIQYSDYEEISTGVKVIPSLNLALNTKLHPKDVYKEFKRIYALMAFFWGDDFSVSHLKLYKNMTDIYISAYLPNKVVLDQKNYALIPLDYNLKDRSSVYEGIPLYVFKNYLNLNDMQVEYLKKYLRYTRLKTLEEKFLGYFRLLEKIVYVEGSYVDSYLLQQILSRSEKYLTAKLERNKKDIRSLLKRFERANKGKYNTATCISKFYETIPSDLKIVMRYKKDNIESICKLRNDITHANDYNEAVENLYDYTRFIKQLLILAIFNKVLDAPLDILIPLSANIDAIH